MKESQLNFELAIEAGIPLISVRTTDTVNILTTLNELCGGGIIKYRNGGKLKADSIYYIEGSIKSAETVYREAADRKSILVIVNPEEQDTTYYDAGILPTPKPLIYEFLSDFMSEKQAKSIIPALGGLTLKEITEVLMLTQTREGNNTPQSIIRTRQAYLTKAQGLEIVDTDLTGYTPNSDIASLSTNEKSFFLDDVDDRLRPRGILVHGIPGTGKTSGAKYLASKWGVPLFRLDATVQSKFVGESEMNLSHVLRQVETESPCILLIDEIEKFFSQSSDGGVTQKLLGSLLWWLQEHRSKVFTYMTSNDMGAIPDELHREGRIDKTVVFKGVRQDEAELVVSTILKSYSNLPNICPKQLVHDIYAHARDMYDFDPDDTSKPVLSHADINHKVIEAIKSKRKKTRKLKRGSSDG